MDKYKVNLPRFLEHVKRVVHADTQLLWLTTMPVSTNMRGGFLIKQVIAYAAAWVMGILGSVAKYSS